MHRRLRHGVRKSDNWLQLFKFCAVGGSGYVVNLIVFSFFLQVVGVHHLIAASAAFVVAVANNFWWNRHWTFEAGDGHAGFQAARFFIVSAIAFACNAALLAAFVEIAGIGKIVGQLIAVTLVMPVSFLGNKYWSFR